MQYRNGNTVFTHFLNRYQPKFAPLHGERASANSKAAGKHPENAEEERMMDETGFFWKKMKEEARDPCFKAQKDRVTPLMLVLKYATVPSIGLN